MTKTRLNIPTTLLAQTDPNSEAYRAQIADTYRAVYLRFLKIYTQHKKQQWDSYTGMASNTLKTGMSAFRGIFGANQENPSKHDPKSITTNNDTLIKEINSARSYESYVSLIDLLSEEAKRAQINSNQKSWRMNFYFAIILLIQESVKLQFPQKHEMEIQKLRQELAAAKVTYDERFRGCNAILNDWKIINAILVKLVLLGDREVFAEAFIPGRKLFEYLTDMTEEMVNDDEAKLTKQFGLEEGRSVTRTLFVNPNIPLQLQRYFPRMLLMSDELGLLKTDNMADFVKFALQDHAMVNTNTPLSNKFFPPSTSTTTGPSDIEDLMRAETPPKAIPPAQTIEGQNSNNVAPIPGSPAVLPAPQQEDGAEAARNALSISNDGGEDHVNEHRPPMTN